MLRPSGPAPDGGRVWQLIDSSTIGGIEKHIAVLTSSLMRIGIPTEIVL